MVVKKIQACIKLQVSAGSATPSPPIGPALGQQGVNIMQFCKEFNEATANAEKGLVVPVVVTVYVDRSFSFIVKTPPASVLLKKVVGISVGSSKPSKVNVGKVSIVQINEIAKMKLVDMTGADIESAARSIIGTAHSMGLEVEKMVEYEEKTK